VIDCDSLEYAQARLQSRHGQRAGEADWQRLETAREFTARLDAARNSPLRSWLVGITAASTSQQIEAVLREHWRTAVSEVAGWMPAAWQAAVLWCAAWPDLPVLQHLARGGKPMAWMRDDAELRSLCAVPAEEQAAALAAGPLAPLAGAWPVPEAMASAWRAEWQRRLPQPLGDAADTLVLVAATVRKHGAAFAAAPPGSGSMLRRALQARLTLLLRRAALEPAAAFIHVALCALDLERLRGELLGSALFTRRRRA
jgi:hypothetical protein